MTGRQRVAAFILLALYLLPIWLYPLFPSQDGPSHLYNTMVFTELLWNSQSPFASYYEIHWWPFPNWTFTVLNALFYPLFPLLVAEKIVLSLYVAGFVGAAFYFFRSVSSEKTTLGFAAFLFSYNWSLLMGFYNFCLSIPLALWTIGYFLRHRGVMHPYRLVVAGLLLLLLYFSHAVSFLIVLGVLAFLFGVFGQRRLRAVGELAAAALPGLVMLAVHAFGQSRPGSSMVRAPLGWLVANAFSLRIAPGFHPAEWVWVVGFWGVLAAAVAGSIRGGRRVAVAENRPWWWVAGGLLVVAMAVPNVAIGGSALNERFPLFLGLFLLAGLPCGGRELRRWLVGAFVVLVAVQLIWVHAQFRHWNEKLAPFLRAARHVDGPSLLLPLMFEDPTVGNVVNPLLHADCHLLAATRSVSPTNYEGYRDHFPVRYRSGAPLAAPRDWYRPESFLERNLARHYPVVLLWSKDESVGAHPSLAGFRLVWAEGGLRLLRQP